MQKVVFIFLISVFFTHCSIQAQNRNFGGKWEYVKYNEKDKKTPETIFTINLYVNKNNVEGWHCSVMHNGGKIDCSDDKSVQSITGQIKNDTLYCIFKSFFSDSDNAGTAIMYFKDADLLVWKITSSPNEKYYIPLSCYLRRTNNERPKNDEISLSDVVLYNERAYKLEQAGKYQEAVNILEKVIRAAPNRIVAYLNIADAYWGLNDKVHSRENYIRYIDLMKTRKKDPSRIPQRAYDRIK